MPPKKRVPKSPPVAVAAAASRKRAPASRKRRLGGGGSDFASKKRFADLPISDPTKRALREIFKYEFMSKAQSEYVDVALSGGDLFVKAKTGTGKTLGFLIPTVEKVRGATGGGGAVRALILSPSRELADQTCREAAGLLTHHPGLSVQMVIGGTSASKERRSLTERPPTILVATPGRLLDHLETIPGFADSLRKDVRVVVFDEADRLLDMGFKPAIKRILAALPPAGSRQALLFTATVPAGVQEIGRWIAPQFRYIDTAVGDDSNSSASASHARIEQRAASVPVPEMLPLLHGALLSHCASHPDHRVIVFFTTARMAQFAAALFRRAEGFSGVLELHSRLSQGQRNSTTQKFAKTAGQVLFASDVIARGIDFPDVTLVCQVGLTDPQQYEHRVGRTGRAGKEGRALLVLGEDEAGLIDALIAGKLPVQRLTPAEIRELCEASARNKGLQAALARVEAEPALRTDAARAYSATLGFYAGQMKRLRMTPAQVVEAVNRRFLAMGLREPPAVPAKTAGKMRLKGAPGLRMEGGGGGGSGGSGGLSQLLGSFLRGIFRV